MTRENVGLLLSGAGELVAKDLEKAKVHLCLCVYQSNGCSGIPVP